MATTNKEREAISSLEFRPVPPSKKHSPGRVKTIPLRLYIERFEEHKQIMDFIETVQKTAPGQGTKTIVRSLIHYRNNVIRPLQEAEKEGKPIPRNLLFARKEFTPISSQAQGKTKVRHLSIRLAIDKWLEHREAYNFLQRMQQLHGEGNKTIIRALMFYEKDVAIPLQKRRLRNDN